LQSVRLWNRAYEVLSQAKPSSQDSEVKPVAEEDPFSTASLQAALPPLQSTVPEPTKTNYVQRSSMDAVEWRIAEGLLQILLLLAKAYHDRGSAKEAEYFASQAEDLSQSLNLPVIEARALTARAETQLAMGAKKLEDASRAVADAAARLENTSSTGIDKAIYSRVLGTFHESQDEIEEAQQAYETSRDVLRTLGASLQGSL
jgi:separase